MLQIACVFKYVCVHNYSTLHVSVIVYILQYVCFDYSPCSRLCVYVLHLHVCILICCM